MVEDKDLEKVGYLCVVKILEARDLKGEYAGMNPHVKITVGNLEPQQTKTMENTAFAIWNQSFTFPDLMLNKYELETFELNLSVFDQHSWFTNSEIGSYSIGLSTMYRFPSSEIYKKWLRLSKPETPTVVVGYIQVSCFIVGPGQEPPVHESGEDDGEGDEQTMQMLRDGADPKAIMEVQKKSQGLSVVSAPTLNWICYQLMINVYKGEFLCKLEDEETPPSAFVSVRSQGCLQKTRIAKASCMPNWQQKIKIPVYVPTWNDKIRVILWHQVGDFFPEDHFMANVPEHPSGNDIMNIATLHSKEGKMDPMWINMYGIRPKEYQSGMDRLHASAFMGRVLMSLHLLPNDRPELSTSQSSSVSKTNVKAYKLWIDIYDLVNCDELLKQHKPKSRQCVNVQAFICGKGTDKVKAVLNSTTMNDLTFDDPKCNEVDLLLPDDISQIPDLFVNVNVSNFPEVDPKKKQEGGIVVTTRAGFLRYKPKDIIKQRDNTSPQWKVVQSIESRKKNVGRLLINARLIPSDNKVKRELKPRGRDVQYYFFAQIFNGYELAPNVPEKDLLTMVEMKIGVVKQQKKGNGKKEQQETRIKTRALPGRFPQWNWSKKPQVVTLCEDAAFASDMRVQLFQITDSLLRGKSQTLIGQFLLPATSMKDTLYKRPQYYNIIDSEGNIQGKILARFLLMKREQGPNDEDKIKDCYRFMKKMIEYRPHIIDLKVSILGIRSLINPALDSQMEISLTNYEYIHGVSVKEAFQKAQKAKGNGKDAEGSEENEDEENKTIMDRKQLMDGVTQRADGTIEIDQLYLEESKQPTQNPNFGKVVVFKEMVLQEDMLLWPHLIIKFYDKGLGLKDAPNEESSRIVVPLFIFADSFMPQPMIKQTLAMLMDDHATENQKQQSPLQIYLKQLQRELFGMIKDDLNKYFTLKLPDLDDVYTTLQQSGSIQVWSPERIMKTFPFDDNQVQDLEVGFKEKEEVIEVKPVKKEKNEDDEEEEGAAAGAQAESEDSERLDSQEFAELKNIWDDFLKGKVSTNQGAKKDKKKKEGDGDDEDEALLQEDQGALNLSPDEEDPVIEGFKCFLTCTDKNKEKELSNKNERKAILLELMEKLRKLQDSLQQQKNSDADFRDNVRFQMMNCRQKLAELDKDCFTEEDFNAANGDDGDQEEAFSYGDRQVNRGPLEPTLDDLLPFLTQPLLECSFSSLFYTTGNHTFLNGIITTGNRNGSKIRYAVCIVKDSSGRTVDAHGRKKRAKNLDGETGVTDDESAGSYDEEFSDEDEEDTLQGRLTMGLLGDDQDGDMVRDDGEFDEMIETISRATANEVIDKLHAMGLKVDIFRPSILTEMVKPTDYTLRVFVRACQNLSAVDNRVTSLRNQIAGDKALSSADPFLNMRIIGVQPRTFFEGRETAKAETLSPEFNEIREESGIRLQEDWRLEIEVKDKATFEFTDTIIGKTEVDLEQRRWSMKHVLAKLILMQEKEKCTEDMKALEQHLATVGKKNKNPVIDEKRKILSKRQGSLSRAFEAFKKKEMPQSSVEFRPLYAPGKGQAQGLAELWVEVLDAEETRQTPLQKIKERKQDDIFEVRLIIWETRDVPPPNGSVMGVRIRASYDPDGLSTEPVVKETDVHNGVKVGERAIFNYRMIFRIGRDEFPRLKIQVFDAGMAGAEACGELTMNLKTSIKLLQKVGVLEDNKIWIPFFNPAKNGAAAGYALIQLQVKYEAEADNDPVGEAWDEPNHDPVLVRPTVGRGVGDKLAGLGLGLPDIALPDFFGLIKKVIIAAMVAMGLFFVMFLILASK